MGIWVHHVFLAGSGPTTRVSVMVCAPLTFGYGLSRCSDKFSLLWPVSRFFGMVVVCVLTYPFIFCFFCQVPVNRGPWACVLCGYVFAGVCVLHLSVFLGIQVCS